MKKFVAVAAVTLMLGGAAFAQTLAVGFINDNGATVSGDPITPATGEASFIRLQNNGASTINMTINHFLKGASTPFHTNTGSLVPNDFFSWRPRNFQGFPPNGTGASANANIIVSHDGIAGTLGGNVVVISSNGSRLGFLIQEQK